MWTTQNVSNIPSRIRAFLLRYKFIYSISLGIRGDKSILDKRKALYKWKIRKALEFPFKRTDKIKKRDWFRR